MDNDRNFVVSYLTIRRAVGLMGILLPFVIIAGTFFQGGPFVPFTVSNTYFTNMREVFTGVLCAVALFLICYKGYGFWDDLVTTASGAGALGVANFPTADLPPTGAHIGTFQLVDTTSAAVHLCFAIPFFLLLAVNSLFLFTKTDGNPTDNKRKRNVVYIVCGLLIVAALVAVAVISFCFPEFEYVGWHPIYWCETLALVAFGTSWLVKGETFWQD